MIDMCSNTGYRLENWDIRITLIYSIIILQERGLKLINKLLKTGFFKMVLVVVTYIVIT